MGINLNDSTIMDMVTASERYNIPVDTIRWWLKNKDADLPTGSFRRFGSKWIVTEDCMNYIKTNKSYSKN
ncbi:helix-turn-helix domain-containing protein [Peribacillus sp. R9-11]|uniref:helix-turn-helix domain-containing protein n=1 Tax=Peribacillus sp. R9-11 TaxID=3073271 RepID=UPI00286939CB|nr:helix-turn-helix domain-containing protein [Peribacillus sp. R9-11]WMX58971.1 helix-turn-helix domain-containing protein [Peribacillus sp. R9-11]